MKIKSLLLGSAAALVAVSGAQAADAIVVEPEPMEYVRVCDMYGAGYFYIPGTETCIKFSGAIRVLYGADQYHDDVETVSDHDTNTRVRFAVDTKNESEMGTVTGRFRVSWQRNGSDNDSFSSSESHAGSAGLDYATINVAGFTAGYGTTRLSIGQWHLTPQTTKAHFLDYQFSAGDLTMYVGIQDNLSSGTAGQPDPYVVANYSMGALAMSGFAVYDSSVGNMAYGILGTYDMSSMMDGMSFTAYWTDDQWDDENDDNYGDSGTDYVHGHQWGVKLNYKLTDKISGFTRWSEHQYYGSQMRTELVWAMAEGLSLAGRYTKYYEDDSSGCKGGWVCTGKDSRFELELTRSF